MSDTIELPVGDPKSVGTLLRARLVEMGRFRAYRLGKWALHLVSWDAGVLTYELMKTER